jgi:hypothetical protein
MARTAEHRLCQILHISAQYKRSVNLSAQMNERPRQTETVFSSILPGYFPRRQSRYAEVGPHAIPSLPILSGTLSPVSPRWAASPSASAAGSSVRLRPASSPPTRQVATACAYAVPTIGLVLSRPGVSCRVDEFGFCRNFSIY